MKSTQQGFTLVELIVTVVILGILAAFAVPKFISIDSKARISAVQTLGGSLRSASSLAHSMAVIQGQLGATGTISMDGTVVNLVFGYPAATAAGIQAALQDTTGFSTAAGPPFNFTKTGATGTTPANCNVTYAAAAAAGSAPTITVSASLATDC